MTNDPIKAERMRRFVDAFEAAVQGRELREAQRNYLDALFRVIVDGGDVAEFTGTNRPAGTPVRANTWPAIHYWTLRAQRVPAKRAEGAVIDLWHLSSGALKKLCQRTSKADFTEYLRHVFGGDLDRLREHCEAMARESSGRNPAHSVPEFLLDAPGSV